MRHGTAMYHREMFRQDEDTRTHLANWPDFFFELLDGALAHIKTKCMDCLVLNVERVWAYDRTFLSFLCFVL